jgi:predicted HTH transcriptional regulator
MERYLKKLIEGGENQQLDFKYCVSDSRKIARTLCAFSNTEGGRILIGVRDNGSIAGISSDEEIYMVDTAVHLYCRPVIRYSVKQHGTGEKTIVEIEVEKGDKRPYRVLDESGRWIAYFRHRDQNLVANRVLLQVWKKESSPKGTLLKFTANENNLLSYLKKNRSVTLAKFRRTEGISARKAETILANLIVTGIIQMEVSEKGFSFELSPEDPSAVIPPGKE